LDAQFSKTDGCIPPAIPENTRYEGLREFVIGVRNRSMRDATKLVAASLSSKKIICVI